MNVTNSIVDFFQGSPYNNPVGSLIEKSTDSKNETENWTLFMEVCDVINLTEDGPKLAIRAIKRRICTEINKDPNVVLYTLTLLETCVKNCGYRFHLVVCSRDFLQEIEKIILNNINIQQNRIEIPIIVRNRILTLLQTWYDSFKSQPDFREIELLYSNLREYGIQFPMTDINTMSPINTPKRSVQFSKPILTSPINDDVSAVTMASEAPTSNLQPPVSMSSENIIDKLSKDLQKVQSNLDAMCELMNEYLPTEHIPDDALSLMKNLFEINSEMQKRLLQLINHWEETKLKESSILFDMLRINDEMNSALAQYERYERTVSGGINKIDETSDLKTRMSKSHVEDVFSAQQEMGSFYDGFSKAIKSNKADQKNSSHFPEEVQTLISTEKNTNSSKSSLGALSSQEFDQFLSEQTNTTFSINNDNHQSNSSRNDRQKPFGAKPKNEKSELFEL